MQAPVTVVTAVALRVAILLLTTHTSIVRDAFTRHGLIDAAEQLLVDGVATTPELEFDDDAPEPPPATGAGAAAGAGAGAGSGAGADEDVTAVASTLVDSTQAAVPAGPVAPVGGADAATAGDAGDAAALAAPAPNVFRIPKGGKSEFMWYDEEVVALAAGSGALSRLRKMVLGRAAELTGLARRHKLAETEAARSTAPGTAPDTAAAPAHNSKPAPPPPACVSGGGGGGGASESPPGLRRNSSRSLVVPRTGNACLRVREQLEAVSGLLYTCCDTSGAELGVQPSAANHAARLSCLRRALAQLRRVLLSGDVAPYELRQSRVLPALVRTLAAPPPDADPTLHVQHHEVLAVFVEEFCTASSKAPSTPGGGKRSTGASALVRLLHTTLSASPHGFPVYAFSQCTSRSTRKNKPDPFSPRLVFRVTVKPRGNTHFKVTTWLRWVLRAVASRESPRSLC